MSDFKFGTGLALPAHIVNSFAQAVQSRRLDGRRIEHHLATSGLLASHARQDAQGARHGILQADSLPPRVTEELDSFMIRNGPVLAPALTRIPRVQVDNPRGTSKVEIPRISDFTTIREGMNPEDLSRGEPGERPDIDTVSISLPYAFGYGSYETSEDGAWTARLTEQVEGMNKQLLKHLEGRVFLGTGTYSGAAGVGFNSADITGANELDTTPDTQAGKWNSPTKTGAQYETDALAVLQSLVQAGRYGAIAAFLHPVSDARLSKSYTENYPLTVRARLLEIFGSIDASTEVPNETAVYFVVPSDGTCRIAMPIPPTVHTWISPAGYRREVLVVARMAPAFFSSYGTDGTDGTIAARVLA